MTTIDITAIILAVIGAFSGWVTFLLEHRKHKQEVANMEAETKAKQAETEKRYMELAMLYVDEFHKNIVKPMEAKVEELTNEVKELKDAIEGIYDCPFRDECPVRDRL